MRSLEVASISIRNFRNLAKVDVDLAPGFNILSGENGQGKTNMLEAVYLVATSRSFRTARLDELLGPQGETSSVRAQIREDGETREQILGLRRGVRSARVDDKRPRSLAEYALLTPVVVFHPAAIVVTAGAGSERRRLLDRVALYLSPPSLDDVLNYRKAMLARQRVLEKRGDDAGDLDGWEELMVQHGLALSDARSSAAARLIPAAERAFQKIGPAGVRLSARYVRGAPSLADEFRTQLRQRRLQDRARRGATLGPHRDELVLTLGNLSVRTMASQGQHRAVVLSLEMAEIDVVAEVRGMRPVLLLDDVSSELDRSRMASLLAALREEPGQVLLTTTRPELIEGAVPSSADRRMILRVVSGTVAPVT